jgi:hypothetical protein
MARKGFDKSSRRLLQKSNPACQEYIETLLQISLIRFIWARSFYLAKIKIKNFRLMNFRLKKFCLIKTFYLNLIFV